MFLVLIFTRGWVDPRAMLRSEGNMSLRNPVTPQGIDPGTVWLVAQRLKHYATPGSCVRITFVIVGNVTIILRRKFQVTHQKLLNQYVACCRDIILLDVTNHLLFSPNFFSCIYFNTFIFCFVVYTFCSCDSFQHFLSRLRFIKICKVTKINTTLRKTK